MTILSRIHMSIYWCIWYKQKIADWKKGEENTARLWTIADIKKYVNDEKKCIGVMSMPI